MSEVRRRRWDWAHRIEDPADVDSWHDPAIASQATADALEAVPRDLTGCLVVGDAVRGVVTTFARDVAPRMRAFAAEAERCRVAEGLGRDEIDPHLRAVIETFTGPPSPDNDEEDLHPVERARRVRSQPPRCSRHQRLDCWRCR